MNIDFNEPTIKFYFSFQCPYSYMTWELLKELLQDSSYSIAPIEVGLFPSGKTKFHFRDLWGKPRWERLINDAKQLGLKISQPTSYVSSLTSARGIKSYGKANAGDYISSVFRAVFVAGIDISLTSSLRLHLQSEGIDSSVLAEALEKPETEKEVNEQFSFWGTKRLRQLPTLEYDEERYSGFMDKYGLKRFLSTIVD
jgi:2-hydroxychromene-2-carboxylate isomerase